MAVGTFVVDYHKVVDHYPRERESARVKREQVSNGGAPLNLLVNLARMNVGFPLVAGGKVGQDIDGKTIVDTCGKYGIDTSQLVAIKGASTGYTDVFTVESTGRHTCFHYSGIGDTFARKDVKLRAVQPKILFLGSLGALGKMDRHNPDYGRKGATQLIRDAHKQGITTVIEISPTDGHANLDEYEETIAVADYLILNDRLAESMLGAELYTDGQFDPEVAAKAAQTFLDRGLRKAVLINAGSSAVYLGKDGECVDAVAKRLPATQRVGSAGIDHAFAAGFIEGLYHDKPAGISLRQGLEIATQCRTDLSPSDGIRPLANHQKLVNAIT